VDAQVEGSTPFAHPKIEYIQLLRCDMADKLQKFNAFGLVSVENEQITIILSAISENGKPLNRTIKRASQHHLGFSGAALVGIDLENADNFMMGVNEIGTTSIADHPDIEAVLKDGVDWLRKSAGII
jgi:hypothetical protein